MKYLSFVRSSEKYRNQMPPPALMQAMDKFAAESKANGTLVDTGGLLPSKDGFRIRLHQGKLGVTNGPFTETNEVIGGWAILNCATYEEAVRVSSAFMELHAKYWPEFEGECEVRPMFAH